MPARTATARLVGFASLVLGLSLMGAAGCGGASSAALGNPAGDAGSGCTQASCPDSAATCKCTGPAPEAPNYTCSDGTTGGPECATHADGTCGWAIRSCPVCPGLGCAPQCPHGVLKDSNGCDTCECTPGDDAGGGDDAGSPGERCTSDADCAGGVCGFPEADGCSAVGTCFAGPGASCLAYSPGCACDGSEVNLACNGLPSTAYAPKPLLHAGVCTDSGSPDGGADAGKCCPANWTLFSCTYPDGGTGKACHDPATLCVSSMTCGAGCDEVVTGRCGP